MGKVGLEPTRDYSQGILSPPRIPFRHSPKIILRSESEFLSREAREPMYEVLSWLRQISRSETNIYLKI